MDRLQELQARLGSETEPLTAEELAELETLLLAAFDEADDESAPDLARMEEISGQIKAVRDEQAKAAEEAAEAQERAEKLRAEIRPVADETEEPEATEEATEEPEVTEEPEAGTESVETAEAKVEEPEAVAAAAVKPARPALGTIKAPAAHRPQPRAAEKLVALTAAGDVPGLSAGQTVKPESLGAAMAEKISAVMVNRSKGRFGIARMTASFPDELRLTGNPSEDMRKINTVVARMKEQTYGGFDDALVASGGICAPETPRYELYTVGSDSRPIRDALPRFDAMRGGITFTRPPLLTDVTGAVGIWTSANDANPSDPTTKPVLTISCGDAVTLNIDAITARAQVGNFDRRTFPENFAAWWGLVKVYHSRVADTELWDAMVADARTLAVTTGELLGAARDILENLDQAATQYRSRHRMPQSAVLDVILPDWVAALMRADLTRQLPGDSAISVTEAQITGYFRDRNLNVRWAMDTGQEFGAQTDNAALLRWTGSVQALMYPPGHFIFLDGGTLDLGTEIRDATLNATNDVEAFVETFEQVAAVGPQALHITMDVCPSGHTSGTVDIAPCTTGS